MATFIDLTDVKMETDDETTGLITKTSKHSCLISTNIGGSPVTLSFNQRKLFTFGIRCEGDMQNILEEGMEVNLIYKLSECQSRPRVIAVWLGDRPDLSKTLETVYNVLGQVCGHLDDGYLVCSDNTPYNTIVTKHVLCSPVKVHFVIGDSIMFDAAPLELEHVSGAKYRATCAWIGKEPRLVDRFALNDSMKPAPRKSLNTRFVYGSVVVIPNESVAFVELDSGEKVMLFRNSFENGCDRIQDIVDVGDRLWMRLKFGFIYHGCRQLFAVKAWKNDKEIVADKPNELCEPMESTVEAPLEQPMYPNLPNSSSACESRDAAAGFNEETKPHPSISQVLFSDPPLSGTLKKGTTACNAFIFYKNKKILLYKKDFFVHGRTCTFKKFHSFIKSQNMVVNFEALSPRSKKNEKKPWVATCAWIGDKPVMSVVASTLGWQESSLSLSHMTNSVGRVVGFYFPDVALLLVQIEKYKISTVVCAHISELKFPPKYGCSKEKCYITDFVRINNILKFDIRRNDDCLLGLCAYNINQASNYDVYSSFTKKKCPKKSVVRDKAAL